MTLYRTITRRAYSIIGAATTIVYMMSMFGINNTLYSLALSFIERLIGPHLTASPFTAMLSNLPRINRRFNS